jgi:hypothetical protein
LPIILALHTNGVIMVEKNREQSLKQQEKHEQDLIKNLKCPNDFELWIRTHTYVNDMEEKQRAVNQTGEQSQDYEYWHPDDKQHGRT